MCTVQTVRVAGRCITDNDDDDVVDDDNEVGRIRAAVDSSVIPHSFSH